MKTLISMIVILCVAIATHAKEPSPEKIAIGLDADANELFVAQQAAAPDPMVRPAPTPPQPPADQIIEVEGTAKTVIVKPPTPRQKYGYARHNRFGWGGSGHNSWGDYHHASTAAEGYLSGLGRLRRGQARFLEGLGRYQNMHQEARTKAIENWSFQVETWWYLKDARREREYGKDYLDKETHRLNQAERRYGLNERRKQLVQKGVLPQPKKQSCIIRGRKYVTVADWRKTADYVLHRLEIEEKNFIKERDLSDRRNRDILVDIRVKQKLVREFISIKGNAIVDPAGGSK